MSVLIVIPTLNEEKHIEDVVLIAMTAARAVDGQVVVADGGSIDATCDIVGALAQKHPRLSLIDNPGRYQSAAINRAVETHGAGQNWLIRLDAHAGYPSDFIKVLLEEAEAHDADSVVVTMFAEGQSWLQRIIADAQNSRFGNGASAHRNSTQGKWVDHGHHALMRLSAFRDVGGYDAQFSHNEDAELDYRLARSGYRIWLTGRTHMTYFPRSDLSGLVRQYFHFGRGRRRNLAKHRQRPATRQVVVALLAPALSLVTLSGVSPVFALPFYFWIVACLGAGVLISRDTGRTDALLAGPIAGVMQLAWSAGFWSTAFVRPNRPTGRRARG